MVNTTSDELLKQLAGREGRRKSSGIRLSAELQQQLLAVKQHGRALDLRVIEMQAAVQELSSSQKVESAVASGLEGVAALEECYQQLMGGGFGQEEWGVSPDGFSLPRVPSIGMQVILHDLNTVELNGMCGWKDRLLSRRAGRRVGRGIEQDGRSEA